MTSNKRPFQLALSTLACAAALVAALPAQAVKYGLAPSTAPGAPPVVNPFTGKQTDVWKLVGRMGGCSGFQITREWAIHAGHCGIAPDGSTTFSNHLGSSTVLGSDCYGMENRDFQLCRLKNPENLAAAARYPALSTTPQVAYALQYGSIMGYGRSGLGDGLAFVGFDGLPFGYDPAVAATPNPVPHTVGGDSGGAAYWFAPDAADPVMVGVLVGGEIVFKSPLYFDQAILDFVRQTIISRGDPAPALTTAAQYFTAPSGTAAFALKTPPTVALTTAGPALSWTTPAATPAVSSFKVTVGHAGILDRSATVAAGTGNAFAINNLPVGVKYIACVKPINSIGAAPAADPQINYPSRTDSSTWYVSTKTPNCTAVDNRATQAVVTGLTGLSQPSSAAYKVTFNWAAASPVPTDLPITRYRVKQSISFPSGPRRDATLDVSTLSAVANVAKGSVVCASVAAVTAAGQIGAQSSQVCVTAN